jgi:gliding motility-associated-like protein
MENNMMANGDMAFVWPDTKTVYSVIVSDTNNCQKEVTATVRMLPLPDVDAGFDIDIAYGESTQLNGQANGSAFWTHNVNPPDILNPFVKPDSTTTYYLTAVGPEGCKAIDSVIVYVISNGMPNAFSPNGDGLNDEFLPVFSPDDRLFPIGFSVYNRWGQRIFYSAKAKKGWDGTYKNAPVDAGTYFYYVEFKIGDKSFTKKGEVTLIR